MAEIIDLKSKLQELQLNKVTKEMIEKVTKLMHFSPPLIFTQSILQLLKEKNNSMQNLAELYIVIEIVKMVSYDYYVNMVCHPEYEFIVDTMTKYITKRNDEARRLNKN